MKKITLRQIAEDLNLSISTVSRALSDNYQISAETKKRVVNYAAEKHFTVNRFAKGLKEGRTNTIGVVICSIDNAFITQLLNGIHDYCNTVGYQFMMMQSRGCFKTEQNCVRQLADYGIDGLLISPSFNSTDLSYLSVLQNQGMPIVLFDRISEQLKTHQVAVDNFNGAYAAGNEMLERGLKSVLIIGCKQDVLLSSQRVNGFLVAMQSDLSHHCIVEECDASDPKLLEEYLRTIFLANLVLEKKVDAIFTTTDSFTTAAVKVLHRLGIKIPLVGFCNSDLAEVLPGSPTIIRQPAYQMGELASKQLMALIKRGGKDDFETIYLPTILIADDVEVQEAV
ncbi:LacI family DNA-binding transcriptional regulator [Pedobacter chitinilyticus]|nr:LacI family DNA-binding transcriptional regulator [Pedobacter chitinilyticus]